MLAENRVVIAGGSGFVGASLTSKLLALGYVVVVLSRQPTSNTQQRNLVVAKWDGRTFSPSWGKFLEGSKALVNLTGHSIQCVFSPENKQLILDSRLDSVRAISEAFSSCDNPPQAWIQASAVGYYGNSSKRFCDELTPPGTNFLAHVCELWEQSFFAAQLPQVRKVALRLGIVLGNSGGAFPLLQKVTRCFLGGHIGSGQQGMSWIHLADLTQIMIWAIETPTATDIYNATAPSPVTNKEFMLQLRTSLNRPWSPPLPAPIFTAVSRYLLGVEPSLALEGNFSTPDHLLNEKFAFNYPTLQRALVNLNGPQ